MLDFFKKIDLLKVFVYIVTAIFLLYIIFICLIAKPDQILFGNVFIKTSAIDFGSFGSLLAGIFSPLAFLWLILNFKQQDKNLKIAELQLNELLIDKKNRRRAAKATFEIIRKEQTEIILEETPDLTLTICFKSDINLKDCYVESLADDSKFIKVNSFTKGIICLSGGKKNITMGEEIYIKFKISPPFPINNTQLYERINISYLDQDGYEQNNAIDMFYSPTNINAVKIVEKGVLIAIAVNNLSST